MTDEHPLERRVTGRPWARAQRTRVAIPILMAGAERAVTLGGEFPITAEDWSHLMSVLEAMRPGLVEEPEPEVEQDVTHVTGG